MSRWWWAGRRPEDVRVVSIPALPSQGREAARVVPPEASFEAGTGVAPWSSLSVADRELLLSVLDREADRLGEKSLDRMTVAEVRRYRGVRRLAGEVARETPLRSESALSRGPFAWSEVEHWPFPNMPRPKDWRERARLPNVGESIRLPHVPVPASHAGRVEPRLMQGAKSVTFLHVVCVCGWESPGFTEEAAPLASHQRHVEDVEATTREHVGTLWLDAESTVVRVRCDCGWLAKRGGPDGRRKAVERHAKHVRKSMPPAHRWLHARGGRLLHGEPGARVVVCVCGWESAPFVVVDGSSSAARMKQDREAITRHVEHEAAKERGQAARRDMAAATRSMEGASQAVFRDYYSEYQAAVVRMHDARKTEEATRPAPAPAPAPVPTPVVHGLSRVTQVGPGQWRSLCLCGRLGEVARSEVDAFTEHRRHMADPRGKRAHVLADLVSLPSRPGPRPSCACGWVGGFMDNEPEARAAHGRHVEWETRPWQASCCCGWVSGQAPRLEVVREGDTHVFEHEMAGRPAHVVQSDLVEVADVVVESAAQVEEPVEQWQAGCSCGWRSESVTEGAAPYVAHIHVLDGDLAGERGRHTVASCPVGGVWRARCACGWMSAAAPSWSDARARYDGHLADRATLVMPEFHRLLEVSAS